MTSPDDIGEILRHMAAKGDLNTLLRRVVNASVTLVEGAEHAGITVLDHDEATTPICTDDLVRRADEQQYRTGEGPCLSAAEDEAPMIKVDDLEAETRWPRFRAAMAQEGIGVRSMLSFQLYTHRETIGALNLYAMTPKAFTQASMEEGQLLATHAAITAASFAEIASLNVALQGRDLIGQAKGILMERHKLTADEAFGELVRSSQAQNRKLRDVAFDLTTTGELPGPRQ